MTSGGEAGARPGRRARRANQLNEASAPLLAGALPQPPAEPAVPDGGEAETPHYHGIASGCARA